MFNRLGLFAAKTSRHIMVRKVQARKLYTDGIYPYPNYYMGLIEHPSQVHYRETFEEDPWVEGEKKISVRIMQLFWAWFFFQLFDDPGVLLGHFHPPNPKDWTDEELGIPPLEAGSYKDWLEKKKQT